MKDRSVRNYQLLVMLSLLAYGLNWYVTASHADDEPCGVWEHLGWVAGTVTWTADSNGNPQASISNATEYCGWSDPCEGTTQENQANPVAYTLISDEVVADGNGYKRQYSWRADSGCNGSPTFAFASHPLPRHWEAAPAITGGEIDGDDEREVDAGEDLSVSVTQATDKDTWHMFGDRTGQANDTIKYKWTASGGSFNGSTTSRSATWEAPEQGGTYTLTCTINDEPAEVNTPDTGSRDDEPPIVRTITVHVIEKSSAILRLYKDTALTHEISDNAKAGGAIQVVLELKVGAFEKLVSTEATIRLEETSNLHTETERRAHIPVILGYGWEVSDNGADWNNAAGATPHTAGQTTRYWRKVISWPSTSWPLGHNGQHSVSMVSVDEDNNKTQLEFKPPTAALYSSGPSSKSVDVRNIVFGDVNAGKKVTTNATEDYFKFDSESSDTAIKEPKIQFKIEDEGDINEYRWWVYIEPTTQTVPAVSWAVISGTTSANQLTTATWNGRAGDGAEDQPLLVRGTYTFDIYIQEVVDADNLSAPTLDQAWLKSECLNITDHFFQINDNVEEDIKAEVGFELTSEHNQSAANTSVDLLDNDLAIVVSKTSPPLPTSVGTLHGPINIHQLSSSEDGAGWRAVFMAEDQCGGHQRDHKNRRAWAVNQRTNGWVVCWIDSNTPETANIDTAYLEGAFRRAGNGRSHARIPVVTYRRQLTTTHNPTAAHIDWSRRHGFARAAVIYEATRSISSMWPGLTETARNGFLDTPRRSQYAQSYIDSRPWVDGTNHGIVTSNVALHELGHALGIDNTGDEGNLHSPSCVMYYQLTTANGFDTAFGTDTNPIHFGGRPHTAHAREHWNEMRNFVGLPPLP